MDENSMIDKTASRISTLWIALEFGGINLASKCIGLKEPPRAFLNKVWI